MSMFVVPMDGLGNTIKNTLSCLLFCKSNGDTKYIIGDERIFEIFNIKNTHKPGDKVLYTRSSATWHIDHTDVLTRYPISFLDGSQYTTIMHKFGANTNEFKYHYTDPAFLKKYKDIINSLEINSNILDYVARFKEAYFRDRCIVGYHIRSWKGNKWHICEQSLSRHKRYHDIERFYKKIVLDILKGYTPFICSDSDAIINSLSHTFNIITNSYNLGEDCSILSKTQRDFIDILLLSKCDEFRGSFLSTFSELVYYFSDSIKAVVIL